MVSHPLASTIHDLFVFESIASAFGWKGISGRYSFFFVSYFSDTTSDDTTMPSAQRHTPVYRACTFPHPYQIRSHVIYSPILLVSCEWHTHQSHGSARLNPKLSPPVLRRRPMSEAPFLQFLGALLRRVFACVACVRLPHFEVYEAAASDTWSASSIHHSAIDEHGDLRLTIVSSRNPTSRSAALCRRARCLGLAQRWMANYHQLDELTWEHLRLTPTSTLRGSSAGFLLCRRLRGSSSLGRRGTFLVRWS